MEAMYNSPTESLVFFGHRTGPRDDGIEISSLSIMDEQDNTYDCQEAKISFQLGNC